MILSAGQLNSLSRFNRNYNVKQIELSNGNDDSLTVHAILKGGQYEIRKAFTLNSKGELVGAMKDESSTTNTQDSA